MSASGPPPIPPRHVKSGSSGSMPILPPPPPRRRRVARLSWVCLTLALCLLMAVVTFAVMRFRAPAGGPQIAAVESSPASRSQSLVDSSSADSISESSPAGDAVTSPAAVSGNESRNAAEVVTSPNPTEELARAGTVTGTTVRAEDSATVPENASNELPAAFVDLQRRRFQLTLPGQGLIRELKAVKLADLPVIPAESLELSLVTDAESGLKMMPPEMVKDGVRSWTVVKNSRMSLGGQETVTLGQFSHQTGELRFQWSASAADWCKPGSLQFAELEVRVGEHRQACRLWKPIELNAIRLNAKESSAVQVPQVADLIDRPESLMWQVKLAGLPFEVEAPPAAKIGETIVMTVGDEPAGSVEVKCQLTLNNNRCLLQTKFIGHIPVLKKGSGLSVDQQEISRAGIAPKRRTVTNKFNEQSKKAETSMKKLSGQLQQKQSAKRLNTNQQNATTNSIQQSQLDKDAKDIDRDIALLESQIQNLQDEQAKAADFAREHTAWCDAVLRVLDALEDRAELRYVVLFQGRQQIAVVRTTGFEARMP